MSLPGDHRPRRGPVARLYARPDGLGRPARSESPGSADALPKDRRGGAGHLRDRGPGPSRRGGRRGAPGGRLAGRARRGGRRRDRGRRGRVGPGYAARGRPRPPPGSCCPWRCSCAGAPLAGVRALSGPPLAALALAGIALVAAGAGWRPHRALFLPLVFAVLVAAAGRTHARVGPEGDEPHYLMVAESLLRDGDLSLERDYAEGRYTRLPRRPARASLPRAGEGRGDLLAARGRAVGADPPGVGPGRLRRRHRVHGAPRRPRRPRGPRVGARPDLPRRAGRGGGLGGRPLSAAPPLRRPRLHRGARRRCCCRSASASGRDAALGGGGAVAVGLAAAALPWLNVRYAPLAAGRPRARRSGETRAGASPSAPWRPPSCPGSGLLAYHQALYGFWDPRRVYGRRPELALSTLAEGLPGLLLDQEFGLLVYAPVLALAAPGLRCSCWRRDRRVALAAGVAVVAVLLTAGAWPMWRGGFNPPARFLVPVAPLLVVAVALVWDRRGLTAGAALLLGWTLWTGLAGAWEPQLVHRDRDGTAPLFRQLSGAREWTGLLPGYVLADPDRHRLAAVWAVALLRGPALAGRRGDGGPRRRGAAWGWSLAAQAAATAVARPHRRSRRRPPGRAAGRARCRAGGWGRAHRASGRPRRSAGGRSTSRTGSRAGPRSAAGCRCRRGDTGSWWLGEALGAAGPTVVGRRRIGRGRRRARSAARRVAEGWEADFEVRARGARRRLVPAGRRRHPA